MIATATVASLLVLSATNWRLQGARAGVLYLNACSAYGDDGNATDVIGPVWQGYGNGAYGLVNRCPQGGSFQIIADQTPGVGETGQWYTAPPASIQIVHAYTPDHVVLIDPYIGADGYSATFYWKGGTQAVSPTSNCCGGMDFGTGIDRGMSSNYFGFQVSCYGPPRPCNAPLGQLLDVRGIQLEAVDNTPPTLLALGSNNLFYQGANWVRGTWPASFSATDDSGICAMTANVGADWIIGPTAAPNQHSWTQCPSPTTMQLTVDTTRYADGPLVLKLGAADAASPANASFPTATLHVDNQPVGLNLTGPADVASTTGGTQYLSATATAGPSGVLAVICSVDGSPKLYLGATADIPVQGFGEHTVGCYAENRAIDSEGQHARSPAVTRTISIRQPSVSTVAFGRVGAVKCVKRRRHVHALHCHPRSRTITTSTERIAHGAPTTVSGWLGTAHGNAIGSQQVRILTAPNDGHHRFSEAASAVTAANGTWSARLPAGPSREVESVYGGTSTVEPATSAPAHLVVPASVSIGLRPHSTRWGDTIQIYGRLHGGYIPPAGELVVLWIGWPGGSTEIGHLYSRRDGRFGSTYTFLRGNGTETYKLWAATARESDYPFASSRSSRTAVTVRP